MKRPKPIKPFKTLEEEANFWDKHDMSPLFDNPKMDLSKLPSMEKEKEEMITLRIQKSVKTKIAQVARLKGINSSTLSRIWLIEKLREFEQKAV